MNSRGLKIVGSLLVLIASIHSNAQRPVFLPDTFDITNADHFIAQTSYYIQDGELDHAKELIDFGLETSNDAYLTSHLHYYFADYLYYKQDYDSAQTVYHDVLPQFKQLKDTIMIAKTLNSIGLIYSFKDDRQNELQFYIEEYELLDQVKNWSPALDVEKIVLLTNIINVYSSEKAWKKVLEHANTAIPLAEGMKDSLRLGSILNSVGTAYKGLNKIDQSLQVYHRAVSIFNDLKDPFRNSFISNNIGVLYENVKHDLDSALYYYETALSGFEKEDYKWGITQAQLGIASVLAKKGAYSQSEQIYQSVIDTSLAYHFPSNELMAVEGLAKLKYDLKKYKEAYELSNRHNNLSDSLFTAEKHQQYAKLESQYSIIQKENEINQLRTERLEQQLQLNKAKLQRQLLFSIIFLSFIASYIVGMYYNRKRKDNRILKEKNQQIQQQYQELEKKNEYISSINKKLNKSRRELKDANTAKNKFVSILAHDLRNPFHTIIGESYLLSKNFNKLSDTDKIEFAGDIHRSCDQVNRLLDNLLEWSKTQTEGLKFQPQQLNFKDILNDATTVLLQNARAKSISIHLDKVEDVVLEADRQMLETILRNIINNSIKFTPNGGSITITSKTKKNKIKVSVADTGVGMDETLINKLFKIDSNFKTRGTNEERGTGLGLIICNEFIKFHKGKIEVESEPQKGSTFHISLPLKVK